jgi:hypothetical protein
MQQIKGDNDCFESLHEFADNITRGGEIEFEYKGKKHSITQPEGKLNYMEMGNEMSLVEFKDNSELLDFKISGEAIKDIVLEIHPFFRAFQIWSEEPEAQR